MELTPPDIVRAAYAELVVTDLDRARWFWVDLLGFVVTRDDPGLLYLRGLGVERDPEKAFEWFQKSAKQGHDWGEVNLADMMRTFAPHRDFGYDRRL